MIRVFGQTDKIFDSNGDCVLNPLKAKVRKEDNDDYYLDLETGLEYVDYFVEGNIVVANTPTGDQAFRIGNVTKTKSKLQSRCYHVFYDSENYLIADSYVVDKNCSDALYHLNNATEPQSEFTTFSDISTINSFRCVRKSLYEAIQTVLERWGGHLVRDNFSIGIKQNIGQDNGIIVQYKKNLQDITCQENWSDVVTKILPVGTDGILLNAVDPSASIYVTSSTQYALPYTKTVSFNQDIDEESYPTTEAYKQALVDDLRAQAVAYLDAHCMPEISYTLKANLDRVTDIGDTIEVIDERLGINMMTNVIGFEYDCISGKYTEVDFGNFANTLSGLVGQITATSEKVASEQAQSVQDSIMSMMENSFVIYDGNRIVVCDRLPKEDAQNVIIISSNGIGFSQSGINGTITSRWDINGILDLNESLWVGGNEVKDLIIDQGSSSGWIFRKYQSGQIEAYYQATVDSSTLTWTQLGSLYVASASVACPLNLTGAVATATMNDCTDVGWIAKAKYNTTIDMTVVRESTSDNFTVNIEVKGTEAE